MRQVETRFLCDMPTDGGPCKQPCSEDSAVQFGFAGKTYEIDLCDKHRAKFEAQMEPFVTGGSELRGVAGNRTAIRKAVKGRQGAFTSKDVRDWLDSQGRSGEVSAAGRLPNKIVEEFELARGR